jgi:hypothetical protein
MVRMLRGPGLGSCDDARPAFPRAMDECRLRISPTGLYGHLQPAGTLRWASSADGLARYGYISGECAVVIGSNLCPRGKHSIRWVAPKQGPQPFMFRTRLEDAIALAERVLRVKGRIA